MQAFRVDDMTCGHCASSITRASGLTDKGAKVAIDLAQHLVLVEPTEADAQELSEAITEAGYTPVPVKTASVTAKPAKSGGCCGRLAIPFLLMALFLERATGWTRKLGRHHRTIQIASGVFMIIIGIMLFTNTMSLIAIWALKNGFYVEKFSLYAAAPTYFTAIFAGLLSFLSPCGLPLVPAYLGYLSGQALRKV